MSEVRTLSVQKRERAGKGAARASRREGIIPGVVYGNKQDPIMISIEPNVLKKEMSLKGFWTHQYDLDIEGTKERVLCHDVQTHCVSDKLLHVDFLRISPRSKLHLSVPLKILNETTCPGVKKGGILNIIMRELDIICTPSNIPEEIEIDLGTFDIGDSLHLKDIKLPSGVLLNHAHLDATVATVITPITSKEDVAADAAESEAAAAESAAAAPAKEGATAPAAKDSKEAK